MPNSDPDLNPIHDLVLTSKQTFDFVKTSPNVLLSPKFSHFACKMHVHARTHTRAYRVRDEQLYCPTDSQSPVTTVAVNMSDDLLVFDAFGLLKVRGWFYFWYPGGFCFIQTSRL